MSPPYPERDDRPAEDPNPCGCFAEPCPSPIDCGQPGVPYLVCPHHGCPDDYHGHRHYVARAEGREVVR